jgi:hypothetical protein
MSGGGACGVLAGNVRSPVIRLDLDMEVKLEDDCICPASDYPPPWMSKMYRARCVDSAAGSLFVLDTFLTFGGTNAAS